MCGICGILKFDEDGKPCSAQINRMSATLKHRGPDDEGIYEKGPISLGHRRLSIIDIAGGSQPMQSCHMGSSRTITYNGEIYNYLHLRGELKGFGHSFNTTSDTEVLLNAYNQWGYGVLEKLEGMFSFAIWDESKGTLFLARDRMGIKPLYYHIGRRDFVFASEVRAILASKVSQKQIENTALDAFLTLGYVPGPKTLFKDILKLLPGHAMTVSVDGEVKQWSYWNFNEIPPCNLTFADATRQLNGMLLEAVQKRLMSEVPLGVFLSGGLDSSAITALMSQITEKKIKTFSVGYDSDDNSNELPFARRIAAMFDTEHYEFILEPYDFLDSIPLMVEMAEEPLVETPAIPLFQIAKAAKTHATVLLSGEGSDEVFAGYGLYRKMTQMEKGFTSPALGRKHVSALLKSIPQSCIPGDRLKKYMDWISNPLQDRYRGTSADVTNRIRGSFYTTDFLRYVLETSYLDCRFNRWFEDVVPKDPLSKMLYVDAKTWLPDDLLLKADKMTMAASIELRVPFLDHKIASFAASLPAHYKIRNGQGKFILKKMMEGILPNEIIYRKKKGFTVPTQRWFAGKLLKPAKDMILSDKLMRRGWFRKNYIEDILDRHSKRKEDYSRRIFSLLVLYQWLDTYKM